MKGAVETMIGIILIAFMAVLSTGYITASLNTQKAQNYHSVVTAEVEASGFSPEVIAKCVENAGKNGYTNLEIEPVTSAEGRSYARIVLTYDYTIPLLNMFLTHQITGYAR